MKMELNRKISSGKRTRHYYITDLIKRNMIEIKYCPTAEMIGDYILIPLIFSRTKSGIMS
jgi:hypothetical protein